MKVRGHRIELGEVEAVLGQHPQVREQAVVARRDRSGENRLVAYVVPRDSVALTYGQLRDYLRPKLPGYMIPSALVVLDALPSIEIQELGDWDLDWEKELEVLRFYLKGLPEQDGPLTYEQIEELLRERGAAEFPRYKQVLDLFVHNVKNGITLYPAHEPGVFNGDMIIFSAVRDLNDQSSSLLRSWRPYVAGDITVYSIDCTHHEMLTAESVSMYGKQLKHSLV